ncbi:MAG: ATP-binding protein [Bifidobacterium pseudolongum]|nr:ATP-binding protein [Bifidobacterium pseudolongum]
MRSPFKPTAGRQPPVLVGRDRDIENFRMAIEEGPGAPERLLFVTGARGIGKTVMLNALSHVVEEQGWITVNETASSGFVSRIVQALQGGAVEADLVHASIGLFGGAVCRRAGNGWFRSGAGEHGAGATGYPPCHWGPS